MPEQAVVGCHLRGVLSGVAHENFSSGAATALYLLLNILH